MQLEQLQQHWQQLDQKLDYSLAIQNELMRQVVMQPARRRLHRLAIWPVIDLVFGIVVVLLAGSFLASHWPDSRLVVPAGVVMIGAIALMISSIRQLNCVAELDWAGPVAHIQRSLEHLRVMKIQQFKWVILLSPLVGFCAFVVGLQWILGWLSEGRFHLFDKFDANWIVANYIFGVVFVPLGYFAARVLAQKCQRYPWWQAVLNDISGHSLKAAALDVERWSSLQRTN
jgi:uncharacterized membrane protein YfcA